MNQRGHLRALLVDDQSHIRQALTIFLRFAADNVMIVAEAGDGVEAVQLYQKLRPDVVFMDLMMPRMNGVEATRCILDADPDATVIGLTSYVENDDLICQLVAAGAVGCISKQADTGEIVDALHRFGVLEAASAKAP
jgi:DNA-binding NarL/FixJ family response regulator